MMSRAPCPRRVPVVIVAWVVLLTVSTHAQDVPCLLTNWTYDVTATGDPAIGKDGTLFVSSGANLYSLAADGTLKWKYDLPNGHDADPPALDSTGTIYVRGGEMLYAVTETATLKWQFNLLSLNSTTPTWATGSYGTSCDAVCRASDSYCLSGTPAVHSDRVSAIASKASVTCGTIEAPSTSTGAPYYSASSAVECWPQDSTQTTVNCGSSISSRYSRICPCMWRPPTTIAVHVGETAEIFVANLPQSVYVLTTSGTIASNSSIPQEWCQGTCYALGYHQATFYIFALDSAGKAGTIYAMTFAGGHAVEQWSVTVSGASRGEPTADLTADGALYVDFHGVFYAISALGEVLWVSNKDGQCTAASANVVYCSNEDTLYMIEARLGIIHWSFEAENTITVPAVGSDGTVYIGSHDQKLYALFPTGELKWTYSLGEAVASVAIGSTPSSVTDKSEVIYVTLASRVVGIQPNCGTYRCVQNQCVPFAPGSPGFTSITACEAACGTANRTAYYCIYNRCVLGYSFPHPQKGFPTNASCNNVCGPYDVCQATLQRVCGADKAVSTAKCYMCCGTHQAELQAAHCNENDFSTFCEK